MFDSDRGQMVVLLAVVVAVGLMPILGAYLQLGYDGDETALRDRVNDVHDERIVFALRRALHNATGTDTAWKDRNHTVRTVRQRLDPTVRALERGWPDTAIDIRFNGSTHEAIANRTCPTGPERQFGECDHIDGVLVQNRTGRTHVYGLTVHLEILTPDKIQRETHLIRLDR